MYNSSATPVLGLVWLIIYKYQNINKGELLQWVTEKLKPYIAKLGGSNVRDFTSSWQNGIALCALVHSLTNDNEIDMVAVMSLSPTERVQLALRKAETVLEIPSLLEAADVTEAPVEAVIMTYLSSARNKSLHGSIVKERDEPPRPAGRRGSVSRPAAASSPPPVQETKAVEKKMFVTEQVSTDELEALKLRIQTLERDEVDPRQKRIRELEAELQKKSILLAEKETALAEAALAAAAASIVAAPAQCAKCEHNHEKVTKLEVALAEKEGELAEAQLNAAGDVAKVKKLEKTTTQLLEQLETLERTTTEHTTIITQKDTVIQELEASIANAAASPPVEQKESSEAKKTRRELEKTKKKLAESETQLEARDARVAELETEVAKLSERSKEKEEVVSPRSRDKDKTREKKSKRKGRSSSTKEEAECACSSQSFLWFLADCICLL